MAKVENRFNLEVTFDLKNLKIIAVIDFDNVADTAVKWSCINNFVANDYYIKKKNFNRAPFLSHNIFFSEFKSN